MADPVILWFRQDLRLADQPALLAAAEAGPVIPVYVLDDDGPGDWKIGGAQRWWLHHSLASLDASLREKGSRLILRRGPAAEVLTGLMDESGAGGIHALTHYEPWWRKSEAALGDRLCLHDGNQLTRIEDVTTGSGQPFRIYSSFWKAAQGHLPPPHPEPAPRSIPAPSHWPKSETLASWQLLPTKPDWSTGFDTDWTPGEAAGQDRLKAVGELIGTYADARNMPAKEGTTRLSPHLHFGEVSARAAWHATGRHEATSFHQELAWRDFTRGVTLALPDYAEKNGRPRYDTLPWRKGAAAQRDLRAWQQGRTGYPIVDAGMRQLWQSGWMHNRVRMITASFLVKHLLLDWREGERWFWDCLVDADYANNAVNWQWVAGTGVDANMFSRIMAPLTQSEKFDAGDYIRHWVPELKDVPDPAIHDPEDAGCRPKAYPDKIVGHREARERALAANRAV
ncbi:deoxyribodipyrimidine photo-lyase [Sphingomonas metalli]|uniref:Deoxyribodipyrimidine photo-lyase n=1 Tax=Sphingomonas metalli TaxID=1779358 RepID=A0A916T5T7_9SPHN|nr:deoxyribodipyrimidine photo-lyase [Sphingomonas metalli]GGB31189.1 deoxyribodipyrimidine photo-lyase [Sphingomonas metalli]